MIYRRLSVALVLFIFLQALPPSAAALPRPARDHLTPEEVELVREAQMLDKRIEIFIKAVDRRFMVLTDASAAASKQVQKDAEKWGPLPKGTRRDLIWDIAKILEEAINNIDDVAARDDRNPLLPKALRRLSEAAQRFQSQLTPMRAQIGNGEERNQLEQALENIQAIIEAANRLPPPTTDKKSKAKS
jgi:acyl-CoA reductase-like NAD-dependent aldehyde dehydrogenase